MRSTLFAIAVAVGLVAYSPASVAQSNGATSQVASKELDSLKNKAASAKRDLDSAKAAHAALQAKSQVALAKVDDLKKQRAGFRRDRELRSALADSLELAKQLVAASERVSAMTKQHASLIASASTLEGKLIDAKLADASLPQAQRDSLLLAKQTLKSTASNAKKIVIPPTEIDPLADPEELVAQAAALAQSEKEIRVQLARLAEQESAAIAADELRRNHARATELGNRDDEQPRRNGSGNLKGREAAPADQTGVNGDGVQVPQPGGVTGSTVILTDLSVVLADLVDRKQIDSLRAAATSADPRSRAAAIKATKAAVEARLLQLQRTRQAVERAATARK